MQATVDEMDESNQYNEDILDEGDGSKGNVSKLKSELESCKQESYFLRRKWELQETVLKDLQTTNELLERELSRKPKTQDQALLKLEEQYRASRERYEERITSLEATLTEKISQIEELQQLLEKQHQEAVAVIPNERSIINDNDTTVLETQIEELTLHLQEEVQRRQHSENENEDLKAQNSELQNILAAAREHLQEKTEALECARGELALLCAQLNAPKPEADEGSSKGNSLFAEVEDRRKQMIDKFVSLKNKYAEAKQMCKAKLEENKQLRAERAAMLKKWENDFTGNTADNDELLKKYKFKVTELEQKLKAEIKKNVDCQQFGKVDPSYEVFQSLLTSKKKEMENLQLKVEDLSMKLLIQEEVKLNIEKQTRFWRYKASSLEAQMTLSKADSQHGKNYANEEQPLSPDALDQAMGKDLESENHNSATCKKTDDPQDCLNQEIASLKKSLRFSEDTKDSGSNLKKTKRRDYPILYIPD